MLSSFRQRIRNRPLIIILIILGIILAALALNGFVQERIAPALLSWMWRVWLMGSGFPQVMTWAFFVAAIPVIAIFSLIRGRPSFDEDAYVEERRQSGPVQVYARLLRQAPEGDYFRMRLVRHLSKLALDTLEYRERLSHKEIRGALESGQIQVEPEVRQYLQAGWRKRAYETGPKSSSRSWLSRLSEKRSGPEYNAWYDPATDKVIQYLERELEVERES
jgi:hypothetical protein